MLIVAVGIQTTRLFRQTESVSVPPAGSESQVNTDRSERTTASPATAQRPVDLEIVTLLNFDAIQSIDNPRFVSVAEADKDFEPDEKVLGISLNGDHHVYSVPMLSRHEIVNDVVGGVPVAVTW